MLTSGKPNLIRRFNRDLIKDLIGTNGPITKNELAHLSGASVPTVNKIVNELESEGLISSVMGGSASVGRKAVSYIINKDAGYFIVFFVQNSVITAGLADNYGEFISLESFRPDMESAEEVMAGIYSAADTFLTRIPSEKLKAIGLGIPGVIDPNNRIIAIPTVPCWEGIELIPLLERRYRVPVFLENDVKLMTIDIHRRMFSGQHRNMVFLYVSKGLGAGIIINGRLYKGFNNFAGEYGFMLPDFQNPAFHSEWTGDLEFKLRPIAEKMILGQSLNDDEYDLFIRILAGIITNFIAVLNPDMIAVCSPNLSEEDLSRIRRLTLDRIPDSCMPELCVLQEEDHGINGVAELCRTEINSKISLVNEKGL